MKEITRLEKDSLMYYQGGGADITLSIEKQNLREFYVVDNSYIVLNALLMPGISNERARLKEEGKRVDLVMFEHIEELIAVYCRLYSAICKYTCFYEHKKSYHTYRDDRMNMLEFLAYGQIYSFMSTKKSPEKNTDFHNKSGILLLEIEAQGDVEYIDMNAVLEKESKYPHEQEILFAPFALLDKEPLEMTEEEMSYRDIKGNPPEAKYLLRLRMSSVIPREDEGNEKELEELYAKITTPDFMEIVRRVWKSFMEGKEPEIDIEKLYVAWKEKLQIYLRLRFAKIKYEVMCRTQREGKCQETDYEQKKNTVQNGGNIQDYQMQMNKLEQDARNYYNYSNGKRVKYRNCVRVANVAVSVLYPMSAFFVALSFRENLQQRTATYLKLDELLRDMRYENYVNKEKFNSYVERYKRIVGEDNVMGQESAVIMGVHLEKMAEEPEIK